MQSITLRDLMFASHVVSGRSALQVYASVRAKSARAAWDRMGALAEVGNAIARYQAMAKVSAERHCGGLSRAIPGAPGFDAFNAEMLELENMPVPGMEALEPVSIDDLPDDISPAEISALRFLIKADKEAP